MPNGTSIPHSATLLWTVDDYAKHTGPLQTIDDRNSVSVLHTQDEDDASTTKYNNSVKPASHPISNHSFATPPINLNSATGRNREQRPQVWPRFMICVVWMVS